MQREIRLGTEGFRGIIGREFTFANLHRLAEAYGRYLLERGGGRVVVGHDTRFQAQAFAQALAAHLGQMGLEAHLLPGPVPTPLLSFAVRQLEAAGGAMVTASHNPPEYLGLKFKDPSGGPIAPEEARRIEALVPEEARESQGPYRVSELRGAYLEALAQLVNLPALERLAQEHPGFTLFHDAMGGAGGGLLRRFFAHVGLPLRLVELRAEPHPLFYGVNPEPIPRNLAATLEALAPASPPSFAVVTDGDADRVGVVLAGGHYFNPHQALAVLAHHRFLQGRRGRVVKNFAVSWILDRLGARLGFEVQTTPIGFKWIKVEFLRGDVLIGGEESGGIGFPEHLPERDGLLAGLLLLQSVAERGLELAEQFRQIEALTGLTHAYDRLDLPLKAPLDLTALEEPRPLAGLRPVGVERLDGVKWLYPEAWLLFRPSGTEPVLRLYAEATSPELVQALLREARGVVGV